MSKDRKLVAPLAALVGLLALVATGTPGTAWAAGQTAASKGVLYAVYQDRDSRAVNVDDRVLPLAENARIVDRRSGMEVEIGFEELAQERKPVAVEYRFRYGGRQVEVVELALTRGRGR